MLPATDYFTGLDLGQTSDYTALAVLARSARPHPADPARLLNHYAVRHLQRFKLGTGYVEIAEAVSALLARPPLPGGVLVVDQTGVGRAVVDMFDRLRLPATMQPITITSGTSVTGADDGSLHVPKKDLVGTLQVLLQSRRLQVANTLPDASVLAKELLAFRAKITTAGNQVYESWRERDHDDLVLAVALAAWLGEHQVPAYTGPLVYWPPQPSGGGAGEPAQNPHPAVAAVQPRKASDSILPPARALPGEDGYDEIQSIMTRFLEEPDW
jgi:hypothetical protein